MKLCETDIQQSPHLAQVSEQAKERMLSRFGEPLFLAAWRRVLMIHLEVDPAALQRAVPYPLDLYAGRAFVTLVSFTMEGMRPRWGGRLTAKLFQPIATHNFLNVRTYVKCHDEPGIHFLAEWLSNRLAVRLGPPIFGVPYHYGKIDYQLEPDATTLRGRVEGGCDAPSQLTHAGFSATGASPPLLQYEGRMSSPGHWQPCYSPSFTEWLMERYTAFNAAGGSKKFFRVWHPPWPQCAAEIELKDISLLTRPWPWFADAKLVGTNYSPGFDEVWMGQPHRVKPTR